MGKALVIVESSAKAKTINKYLDDSYIVKSSTGRIRDLPTNSAAIKRSTDSVFSKKTRNPKKDRQNALINRMGVDPWHNWQAQYEVIPGKEKVVNELKKLAEKADHIYLATDIDREGEAIAWHLREIIGGGNKRYSRIVFSEITKNAIRQAFEKPGELNINRVNAQQARRFMDRVVGYMISPLLSKRIARRLSAGRVQSVAVRLVVEREREIKAFIPKEFWGIDINVSTPKGDTLGLRVIYHNGKSFHPKDRKQTMAAATLLRKAHYKVLERENNLVSKKPNAPFITSTLQYAASIYLGFSVKKTMAVAQFLYEAGYITYIRTDSVNLSRDSVNMVREYIDKNFGKKYLPKSTVQYVNKKNSQEAHEAIRPTDVFLQSEVLKDMSSDAQNLYQLIWRQFLSCQMTEAKYDLTTLIVEAGDFYLKACGHILRFDGWSKVTPMLRKGNEDQTLSSVEKGDELFLTNLIPVQNFTKPPRRFSEALLVKELEKRGIGRPSTYSSIISTIQNRGYVRVENRCFYSEKIGEIVTDRLKESFRELMNYDFTARMENRLDEIANHHTEWKKVLDNFFNDFTNQLNKAEKDPEEGGMQPNKMVMTNIDCPVCHRKMGIRNAITGVFLSCSGYTLPLKERCKNSANLVPNNRILNMLEVGNTETNSLHTICRCKKCRNTMNSYLINAKYKLHICSNNPICGGYEIVEKKFCIKNHDDPVVECEKCGDEMYLKIGRFGRYMACTNDKCKNTRKILSNGKIASQKEDPIPLPELLCEKSNSYFVLRNGEAGIFLAANTFPKSRETRAPLVEELYAFRSRLPEKLHYLADAPQCDIEGNKTAVRFSRKTRRQYIVSEKEGKSTGWSAFFINGKWVEGENNS